MIIEIKEKKADRITNAEDVAEIFRAILKTENEVDQDKEHFWTLGLDPRHHIKYIELVSMGILTASLVHPREVFRLAIMQGVESLIVCHNHPSGGCDPSEPDKTITKQLAEAGKVIGIPILDHVIIGEGYFSFAGNTMTKIIDCYKQGKKQCEIYPAELSAEELTLTLELQAHQGRVCQEREVKNEKN